MNFSELAATQETAERALRESEARFRQLLEHAPSAIFAKDRDGRYLWVSREFERLVGARADQIVGHTDAEIFGPTMAALFRKNDLRVMLEGRPLEFEETGQFVQGTRTYLTSKFPLFNEQGEPYAVCGLATDITARKRIEAALGSAALAVSSAQGESLFVVLARYLARILQVECAFVAALEDDGSELRMLAFVARDKALEPFAYPLSGSACETVIGSGFRIYPDQLGDRFKIGAPFSDLGVVSYAGYPLNDSSGRALGVMSVLSSNPLVEPELVESVLKIFAVRASAELERMQADARLRASEASYREIFDASEDAIFVHDWDTGAFIDVNPKACAAYGYTREELLSIDVSEISLGEPPYTLADAVAHIERAKAHGSHRFEWRRKNKDGSLHWDEVYLRAARIGGAMRVLAFTREITERKLALEEVRRSEDLLRATVDAALDCIVTMDENGAILSFNPAAEACFGLTQAQVIGKPLSQVLIPERYREAHERGLRNYLKTGHGPYLGRRIEIHALRGDGTEFPAELAVGVAEGSNGKVFIGYLRDLTETKRAEARRAELETQLRQAQKMEALGQLTGGIAHDFNNLLASIMGYVVLSLERSEVLADERLAGYLEKAHESCTRARDLVQQMLMFSRGQKGATHPVDLRALAGRALTLLRASLPASIEVEFAPEGESPIVNADPLQIERVISNLCLNARDALGGAGSIRLSLHAATHMRGVCTACRQAFDEKLVEIRVEDKGCGIPPEVLERIFEPFFSTKALGKGMGMGLATVHGIVHDHRGHVVVTSTVGAGTTFRVLLPSAEHMQAHTSRENRKRFAAPKVAGNILIVDDETSVGEFMRELLTNWGANATFVDDPAAGLQLVTRQPTHFDLIVTDQAMPNMSGLDLARAVRALRADLPVILYTGFGDRIDAEDLAAVGVRHVLGKPVEPHALAAALEDCLR
jgi:PAS domain S-box-containing protein